MSEELKKILEEQGKLFHDFKKANDEQISALKAGQKPDPLLVEKVEKMNARLTELDDLKSRLEKIETKAGRPNGLPAQEPQDVAKKSHADTFYNGFIRKGHTDNLKDLEAKAMNLTTPADGGYAVPEELDREIINLMKPASVMRQLCRVIVIGTSDYRKLVNKRGATSGWVGEADSRPATDTPSLAEVTPYMGELYANPQATQQSLDDVFFNIEEFLATEIAEEFSSAEETAFTTGNGTKKPKGFLAYTMSESADGTRAFGEIQIIKTGADGAFKTTSATVNPADDFIDLIGALKAKHLAGACFQAAKLTVSKIRKFKDNNGAYVWQPSLIVGQPNTLLGYPIHENEAMPAVASNALAVAFGNFMKGYFIVDRIGTRMLRDPFSNKPYVGFYTTKRVGGMVVDSEAIKVLKLAA